MLSNAIILTGLVYISNGRYYFFGDALFVNFMLAANVLASKQVAAFHEVVERKKLTDTIEMVKDEMVKDEMVKDEMVKDVIVRSKDLADLQFIQCLKAFGHLGFCERIKNKLPII